MIPDVCNDTYWSDEFDVTAADLDRIAATMRRTGQAQDLTTLARHVVRGRLRHRLDTSTPARTPVGGRPATDVGDSSMRLWDPAAEWAVGDQVIVAVSSFENGGWRHAPYVGEVVKIEAEKVTVQIGALGEAKSYSTQARYTEDDLEKWQRFVEKLVQARRENEDVDAQIEFVILGYGARIVSRLLNALRADERFLRLNGRWFLRELAGLPTEEQLIALA